MAEMYAAIQPQPTPTGEVRPPHIKHYFQSHHRPECLNYAMKVREVQASVVSREGSFRAIHVVKQFVSD